MKRIKYALGYAWQRLRCLVGKHRGAEILGCRCCHYCNWQESDMR